MPPERQQEPRVVRLLLVQHSTQGRHPRVPPCAARRPPATSGFQPASSHTTCARFALWFGLMCPCLSRPTPDCLTASRPQVLPLRLWASPGTALASGATPASHNLCDRESLLLTVPEPVGDAWVGRWDVNVPTAVAGGRHGRCCWGPGVGKGPPPGTEEQPGRDPAGPSAGRWVCVLALTPACSRDWRPSATLQM